MINLVGNKDCDRHIKLELERARIPIERALGCRNEVPYSVIGQLGGITFKRAWTYWDAEGLVPLETAEELYSDPVGRTDIRVSGLAGAPAPLEWVEWRTPDGTEVWPTAKEAEHRAVVERFPLVIPVDCLYSDNPEELGAKGFISNYHIDTEVGLRVFADTLRAHSLTEEPVQA